jgi:PBP1b-binding outer membrane lipoprotein LpoB
MIRVWRLALAFLLFSCSSTSSNQSTFVTAPALRRQETPIEPPKAETKQDTAPEQPINAEIKSAIRASDEARKLLDRRRYILDAVSDKDNVH